MRRLALILLSIVAVAGCGGEEEWGGYTESEAKQIMSSPQFREDVINLSPPGGSRNYAELLPSEEELDQAGIRKVTTNGQPAWEYRDSPNEFCMYLWKDDNTGSFTTQVGPCQAD